MSGLFAAAAVRWLVFLDSNLKRTGYDRSYLPNIVFAKICAGPERAVNLDCT